MPLFLDEHDLHGPADLDELARAHQRDLFVQGRHGVTFQRYWVDEAAGKVFCLVEAPNAEAVARAHAEANGSPGDRIHAVTEGA
ncbi:MAG: DUF4242 domain-containing protein [Chloroflexi bacterium]|nr:DUF4242 domain-containing protein [Chloroflexota bacterium]